MMNISDGGQKYRKVLATVILLSSIAVIGFNYYSIKILSSLRAYITGEALYSKAQKDAIQQLSRFVYTGNERYFLQFKGNLKIPLADRQARIGLETNRPYSEVRKDILEGKNHAQDVKNTIWLYRNFNQLQYFRKATAHWKKSDKGLMHLNSLAEKIYKTHHNRPPSDKEKESFISQISALNSYLDYHERRFSEILGDASRKVALLLFVFNIIFILLIFINIGLFFNTLLKKLNRAREHIEEQNRVKEEFLSMASHELKSPITFMKASVQILERFAKTIPENNKIHPFIINSGKQVERLNHLVQELLDVTKIQSGKLSLQMHQFQLDELIREVIEVKKQNLTHHLIIHQLHSVTICGDHNRIYQVLENLLSNAMKYSVPQSNVTIWTEILEESVKVNIQDQGSGIPEEKIPMLFDRFYRLESTQHTIQGLGLGLYICSEIIKSHNGTIGVESTVDKGSTFWFTLPIVKC